MCYEMTAKRQMNKIATFYLLRSADAQDDGSSGFYYKSVGTASDYGEICVTRSYLTWAGHMLPACVI